MFGNYQTSTYDPTSNYGSDVLGNLPKRPTPTITHLPPRILKKTLPPQYKTVTLKAKVIRTRLPPIGPSNNVPQSIPQSFPPSFPSSFSQSFPQSIPESIPESLPPSIPQDYSSSTLNYYPYYEEITIYPPVPEEEYNNNNY